MIPDHNRYLIIARDYLHARFDIGKKCLIFGQVSN